MEDKRPNVMRIIRGWHDSGMSLDEAKAMLAMGVVPMATGIHLSTAQRLVIARALEVGFSELNQVWGVP